MTEFIDFLLTSGALVFAGLICIGTIVAMLVPSDDGQKRIVH